MRLVIAVIPVLLLSLGACAPDVGSKKWCEQLDAKDKGEWTVNEAKEYAKYCLLENYTDKED